jgi:phosphotransferase system enzyme I (PtsP)
MAGRPLDAIALATIGFRSLSMGPAAIGPIKAAVRSLDLAPITERVNALIDQGASASEIRGELRAWAETHSVPV